MVPNWQSLNPHNKKNNHKYDIFLNVSSEKQYFWDDNKKLLKVGCKRSNFVWNNKKPSRAQTFCYFFQKSEQK